MIICAAIKDTRTGAVFGGIRHGDIRCQYNDCGDCRREFWTKEIDGGTDHACL